MEYSADLKCPELPRAGQPQVGRISWRILLLGVVISSTFLFLLLRRLDYRQLWIALVRINGPVLTLPIISTLAGILLCALRWRNLFSPRMKVGFWICFGALGVGNMANNILPARGGDFLRCFLVARRNSLTRGSTALATLGLEKILDGLALLTVLMVSSLFFAPPQWFGRLAMIAGIVFGGALAMAILLHHRLNWIIALTHSIFRVLHLELLGDEAAAPFEWFAQGLGAIGSPSQLVRLVVLTAGIWAVDAVGVWGLAWALRIPVSFPGAALVSAIVGLSTMIPAGPGYLGTYDFFSVAALRLLGVEFASATALTLLMHAWSFSSAMVIGATGLGICGVRFSRVMAGDIGSLDREELITANN
jgi:uncharacterized protein (TIRG00374 family)